MNFDHDIHNIPIVRDFLDIFANELSGLPLEREIEFAINLLSGTLPISKAPC